MFDSQSDALSASHSSWYGENFCSTLAIICKYASAPPFAGEHSSVVVENSQATPGTMFSTSAHESALSLPKTSQSAYFSHAGHTVAADP